MVKDLSNEVLEKSETNNDSNLIMPKLEKMLVLMF